MAVRISIQELATPIGNLLLAASESGLTGIEFDRADPLKTREELRHRLARRLGEAVELVENTAPLAEVAAWLKNYFADPPGVEAHNGPLDLGGTSFQRAVWGQLLKIPGGEVRSYKEVAVAIGKPGAVRAVGGACGANPVPVVVPCHRVVASDGPGGFGGGLELKRKMLAGEGVCLP